MASCLRRATAAAVLLVDGQPEEAELRQLADVLPWECSPLVVVGGAGRKDLIRELADHGLEQSLVLG